MYECVEGSSPSLARPVGGAGFRFNWWVLGLAGVAALALAVSLKPAPAAVPLRPLTPAPQATPPAAPVTPALSGPAEVSLFDPLAKAGIGLLIVYAAGWGLVRMRGGRARSSGGWFLGLPLRGAEECPPRLRISETLTLGRQQGALHLVEVEDATLLVGVVMDQMQVLWSSVADTDPRMDERADATAALAPVVAEPPPPVATAPRSASLNAASEGTRLGWPVRAEADWAMERGRLISALMKGDPAMGGGERP